MHMHMHMHIHKARARPQGVLAMHVCAHARMHACVCVCVCMHVCMHACMHVCMHDLKVCLKRARGASEHILCMYACMYVCINVGVLEEGARGERAAATQYIDIFIYIYIHTSI